MNDGNVFPFSSQQWSEALAWATPMLSAGEQRKEIKTISYEIYLKTHN